MKKWIYVLIACILLVLVTGCLFHTIKDKDGIEHFIIGIVADSADAAAEVISDFTGVPKGVVYAGITGLLGIFGYGTKKGFDHKKERIKLGKAYQEAEQVGDFAGVLKKHGVKDSKFFDKYIKENGNAGNKVS